MTSDTFDPADWLRRFKAVGGWYLAIGDDVQAGWRMDSHADALAARETWREIEHSEDRRAALRAVIIDE